MRHAVDTYGVAMLWFQKLLPKSEYFLPTKRGPLHPDGSQAFQSRSPDTVVGVWCLKDASFPAELALLCTDTVGICFCWIIMSWWCTFGTALTELVKTTKELVYNNFFGTILPDLFSRLQARITVSGRLCFTFISWPPWLSPCGLPVFNAALLLKEQYFPTALSLFPCFNFYVEQSTVSNALWICAWMDSIQFSKKLD